MRPFPVSSRRILACRDTLAAGTITRGAGMCPVRRDQWFSAADNLQIRTDLDNLPARVSAIDLEALPGIVQDTYAGNLPELHAAALGQAWTDGAWDLAVDLLSPLHGPQLGLVAAGLDYESCDAALLPLLLAAAQAGRLAMWMWRPMRNAPLTRSRAHHAKDASLEGDGGRAGEPPAGLTSPIWTWEHSRQWVIRLGRWSEAHKPPPPKPRGGAPQARATGAQRAYIVALRRRTGLELGDPLPASLGRREASAMIDRLLAGGR